MSNGIGGNAGSEKLQKQLKRNRSSEMARPKGAKDKQKRKQREPGTTRPGMPEYASHGNIKHMVEKNEKAEEISRIVNESVQYFNRKRPENNAELMERLNEYFRECIEKGQIPTVEDMALSLGVTRQILWNWENKGENYERREIISKAKEVLAGIDAKLVSEGKIPQVTYIFRAKNYFGMRDQTQVTFEQGQDKLEESMDEERLRQKYLNRGYEEQITIDVVPIKELPAEKDVIEGEIK